MDGVKIYSPPNRVTRHGELSRGLPTGVTVARLGWCFSEDEGLGLELPAALIFPENSNRSPC